MKNAIGRLAVLFTLLPFFIPSQVANGNANKVVVTQTQHHEQQVTKKEIQAAPKVYTVVYKPETPKHSTTIQQQSVTTQTHEYYNVPLSHDLQLYISKLCKEKQISMTTVLAVMKVESGFDANRVSPTGDYGLMQINLDSQRDLIRKLGGKSLLDPYFNITVGITILAGLTHKFGDNQDAYVAYNCGLGGAESLFREGIYSTSYSRKVEYEISKI